MKILLATFLVLVSGLELGPSGRGNDAPPAVPGQDLLQRGPQHARLQQLVGTWDAVLVAQDQGGVEQRTQGTLTTLAHADFHTQDSLQAEFMGMKFVGLGINGYCTIRRQYFTLWTDSMTPSPLTLYGDYDAEKRELSMRGECFGMSGKLEPCRTVTRYQDSDHFSWALFGAGPDGKEMQHLRIEYTRRK